jgi:hypothetical protein
LDAGVENQAPASNPQLLALRPSEKSPLKKQPQQAFSLPVKLVLTNLICCLKTAEYGICMEVFSQH